MFSYFIDVFCESKKTDVRLDRSWQNSLYMNVVLSQLQPCSIKVALTKINNNDNKYMMCFQAKTVLFPKTEP